MPKVLIVAATKPEIEPLLQYYAVDAKNEGFFTSQNGDDLSVLITGVGLVNTAFQMGKYSHYTFDYIFNLGIAGAFNRPLKIGEVVNVVKDTICEMGAEAGEDFISYPDLNLGGTNVYEAENSIQLSLLNKLTRVNSVSVNTVHGNEHRIKKTMQTFHPDIESMEGAAFMRACSGISCNYLQIRSISNYVEMRDKSKWDIPLAIKNLNAFALELIQDL